MTDPVPNAPIAFETEPTPEGEQTLILGVKPLTDRARLALLATCPLVPRVPQKPLDIGLFDEAARSQLSLF